MSVSEAMTKRRRRSFSPEFKREIVALCLQPGKNGGFGVRRSYELAETAVRRWVHQAEVDAGMKPGYTQRRRRRRSPGCVSSSGR